MGKGKANAILRSTTEGKIYTLPSEFFSQKDVQNTIKKLMESNIYKQIKSTKGTI